MPNHSQETPSANKSGTLTIAGSGIASVAHITLGTLAHLKSAERVYYLVCDPLTESYIKDNSTGTCFNLIVFYDTEKSRHDSYTQMSEIMLRDVRTGYDVLGIFYGHPGVFVSPSHRAISLARQEGYSATMLPGISSEDCLFADLGIDPAEVGCMTSEATELLLRNRPLNPTVCNIIWQVGCVGVANMQWENGQFLLLVDRLEEDFGVDHNVVHYVCAILPQSETSKDTFRIGDLRKPEVVRQFTTASTLFVPPRNIANIYKPMVESMGGAEKIGPHLRMPTFGISAKDWYGPIERKAIAEIDNHDTSASHRFLQCSPAIKEFMLDLALNPKSLAKYKADPSAVVKANGSLTAHEKLGLKSGKPGPVYALMTTSQAEIETGREATEEELVSFSIPFVAICIPLIVPS
jgi:hypothetical protein